MPFKKLLGALTLVAFVSQAGLLGASQDANAYSAPISTYNDSGSGLSSTLDVKLVDNKALLKIAGTSSLADSAEILTIGAVWLGAEFAEWIDSGTVSNGPGVTFSSRSGGSRPSGHQHLQGPRNPWKATWAAVSANSPALKNGTNPGELLTLTLLFKAESAGVTDEQLARMIINTQGDMRVGNRVNSCDGVTNCSITAASIPDPIWLFASALLGLLAVGYRRQKVAAA